MEKDNEINVNGGDYDFGARIYDSRLGRWLSKDPLESYYPSWSTYNFGLNNPLFYEDQDGMGVKVTVDKNNKDANGKTVVKVTATLYLYSQVQSIRDNMQSNADFIKKSIEDEWNNPQVLNEDGTLSPSSGNFTDGEYVFVFEVNTIIVDDENEYKKLMSENTDMSNNYITLDLPGTGNNNVAGGNTGTFLISDDKINDRKSYAHEFGHLMGYVKPGKNDKLLKYSMDDYNGAPRNGCFENMQHIIENDHSYGHSIMSTSITHDCESTKSILKTDPTFNRSNTAVLTSDFKGLNFGKGLVGGDAVKLPENSGMVTGPLNKTKTKGIYSKVVSWINKDSAKKND